MGDPKQLYVLASDASYGFVVQFEELLSKNRAGKAILKLPANARVLSPQVVKNIDKQCIAVLTNAGYLLVFPLKDLPQLARGKGNKLIGIPSAKAAKREEYICQLVVLDEDAKLTIYAGKRKLILTAKDLAHYRGERGKRGSRLPAGFQRVERVEIN